MLAQIGIVLFLAFVGVTYSSVIVPPEFLVYPLSVSIVLFSGWALWSWYKISGSLFDPFPLFLMAAFLFNGGQAYLEIFALNEEGILQGAFSATTVVRTLYLVLMSLATFHLGGLLSFIGVRDHRHAARVSVRAPVKNEMRIVGWTLLAVSIIPSINLLLAATSQVMSFGYFALFQRQAATGFGAAPMILGSFLIPSTIFLCAGSDDNKVALATSAIIVLGYSVIQLFLGARAGAALPLIAYAWVWHRCIRPLPKFLLITCSLSFLFILFPLVREIRDISGAERSTSDTVLNTLFSIDNPVTAIISEMGGSMGTVAHTLELVPETRPFDRGIGYFYAISTIVPNVFGGVHPAVARGLASDWLVWTVDPGIAAAGGGLGFSFIAEAFLNFGWVGATLALGVFGALCARLVLWANRSSDPVRQALVGCFLAFFLVFARGEASSIVRPLTWYSVFPYLLVRGLSSLRRLRIPANPCCMPSPER